MKNEAKSKLPTTVIRRRHTQSAAEIPELAAADSVLQDEHKESIPEASPLPLQEDSSQSREIDETLLTNFTHQIINPLNGVLGTLDNVIDGTIPDHRRPQRLKAMRGQLVSTIELVRNLAYLSQLSTRKGREGLSKISTDVNVPNILIQAAQFFQESAEQRSMNIHLQNSKAYVIKGHKDLLRQVFMNIIENGTKYGDESSKIQIVVRPQHHTGRLIVEITGTGNGFRPEERERIFDLGFRGIDAQNVRASGSGIGLHVCRQVLDLHAATIDAEYSITHRKTTFRIRFPEYKITEQEGRENGQG